MGAVFSPLIPSCPPSHKLSAQRLNTRRALGLEHHITTPFSYDSLDHVRLSPRLPVRTVSPDCRSLAFIVIFYFLIPQTVFPSFRCGQRFIQWRR